MAELSPAPKSIQTIYSWYRDGQLYVNRRYQRKLVWALEEKQKLIDSVLRNFPIPAIILAEVPGDVVRYEIIDGLQRLHAIMSFIETSFPTLEGEFFDLESFPTALKLQKDGVFDRLSDERLLSATDVTRILDYSLATAVMRNASDEEINDVFDRINTYGHRLSNQERRQAGFSSPFSDTVRELGASLRGDVSDDILPLADMPSISIDMPSTSHGYNVQAEDVFWVRHGIILATDLRDSQDEECIADLLACMVSDEPINRSRAALDAIYDPDTQTSQGVISAFAKHGADRSMEEFKYVIGEIEKICQVGGYRPLKRRLFSKSQGNAFPTIFATVFLAIYETAVKEKMKIADYDGIAGVLEDVAEKLDAGKKGAVENQRRQNINLVKGLIRDSFVDAPDLPSCIYENHGIIHIEDVIKRSQIELGHYELKQGLLDLNSGASNPDQMINKVLKTICAIANNGPNRSGKIIIGVSDSEADAKKAETIDNIKPRQVASRLVVGVNREAERMGVSIEEYIHILRDRISSSGLSDSLKGAVLSDFDYNDYFGFGLIIISVRAQEKVSFLDGEIYFRELDQTKKAEGQEKGVEIASRF